MGPRMNAENQAKVLDVDRLTIAYETRGGEVEAVRDVAFTVKEGETLGLVGESGCGKSTVAFGIVNFLGPNGRIRSGSIRFRGDELVGRSEAELKRLRGNQISMVYQDPMQALNPSVRLGEQLLEVLLCHTDLSRHEARERCLDMLRQVRMPDPEEVMRRYPHQISGGQQQRVVIAMSMLNNPALLIMDEPTTALDVTVEAAVLDLIEDLNRRFRAASIFITHNLGVVARVSNRLCVLYAGQVVEQGAAEEIFRRPRHPYTMGLLASVPRLGEGKADAELKPIPGRVPPPSERPADACIFFDRCDYATDRCRRGWPALEEITEGHRARCIYARDIHERPRSASGRAAGPALPDRRSSSRLGSVLEIEGLKVYYPQESSSLGSFLGLGKRRYVKAVDGISLGLSKGKTLGLVGESGCGKSTLVKGLIGLEPITGGDIRFLGMDVSQPVSDRETRLVREMQMVFQNPDSTLNPSYTIGRQIARPIRKFRTVPRRQVREEVIRLLQAVRLDAYYYDRLPRQLSGGEKQRVGIARALASRPDLIICDEPVSALDVSVQAAVINLLLEIQERQASSMIFIAHDLSVVRYFSDDIAVMYLGQIVEIGPAETVYAPPYHPYTEALLSAVPIPDPDVEQKALRLGGDVPSALHPPAGCRFHTRCPRREEFLPDGGRICETEPPPWRNVGEGHRILCHIPLQVLGRIEAVVH